MDAIWEALQNEYEIVMRINILEAYLVEPTLALHDLVLLVEQSWVTFNLSLVQRTVARHTLAATTASTPLGTPWVSRILRAMAPLALALTSAPLTPLTFFRNGARLHGHRIISIYNLLVLQTNSSILDFFIEGVGYLWGVGPHTSLVGPCFG